MDIDPQYNELLKKALQGILDSAHEGKEFVIEQAPLVVKDFVTAFFIDGIVTLGSCATIATVLVGLISAVFYWTRGKSGDNKWFPRAVAGAVCAFALIPCIGEGMGAAKLCLKAKFAPRALILEKAAELINKKGE